MAKEKKAGVVTHYYTGISVGTVKLSGALKKGDTVHFKGKTTDFTQPVESMQLEHKDVEEAKKGDEVGIKVTEKVRDGDGMFLVD